jgi:L-serine dehydratase
MLIAKEFCETIKKQNYFDKLTRIRIELFGSLGSTGIGHQSNVAVILGLLGNIPKTVNIDTIDTIMEQIKEDCSIKLLNEKKINFSSKNDLILHKNKTLPFHPNAIKLTIFQDNNELFNKTYYSIGGGEIVADDQIINNKTEKTITLPYSFSSAKELLNLCEKNSLSVSELILENEKTINSQEIIENKLIEIWQVMKDCVQNGLKAKGNLPGGLNVPKRAFNLYTKLKDKNDNDPLVSMDWVNLFAIAVNEENASTRRVVTAPTNGAAGIIPAVLHYITHFLLKEKEDENKVVIDFLLTAGAIGLLYQKNASISGADVGCQGEVGVACSMAAAGLAQYLGASIQQIEYAAEIGMEHNLGLTCDPIGGLVQIPCIERNAMGAIKAVNAARMALNSDGKHYVSLDSVIKTMYDTGRDMKKKYKETSQGGLAVHYVEC